MKRMLTACLSAGLLVSMVAMALAAAQNYAGTWALDKSKSGELPRMWQNADSIQMDVTQNDKTLGVTVKGGRGDETLNYNLDGTPSTVDMGGRMPGKATLAAKVNADGSVELKTQREVNFQNNPVTLKTTEVWQLADGGKTLKVKRTSESPRGTQESNLVFAKR
jgi:chitinase